MQDSHLKLLYKYSVQLKAKDAEKPISAEYSTFTITVGNEIVFEFSDSFQYGRLWEGLLLGKLCGGIPLSNNFELSMININQ